MTKYEKRAYEICAADGIRWDQLTSKSRQPHVLSVRRKIAKELRGMGCSFPFIASILKRHHSAVMNLIERRKNRPSVALKAKGFDPIHLGC